VKELHNLLRLPDELSLDRREEILAIHSSDGEGDCLGAVAHGMILLSLPENVAVDFCTHLVAQHTDQLTE
ncbi:MAG TPA: hypothetical protein VLS44_02585, partial [Nitrospira sp.]|nr:hypothetical protein [Nitrospira sp.]